MGRRKGESVTSQGDLPDDITGGLNTRLPQMNSLLDTLPTMVAQVGADHRYRYVNPAYARRFSLTPEKLVGRRVEEIVGSTAFGEVSAEISRALAGESVYFERLLHYGPNNDRFMRVTYSPELDDDGTVIGYFALIVDATEQYEIGRALQASEERYRAFISQSSEGIWRFELDKPMPTDLSLNEQVDWAYEYGYLAECNDAMARQYGIESAESLVGARLGDLLVRDDPKNTEFLKAFVRSDYRLIDAESHERDIDGNDRYFLNNFVGTVEDGHLLRAWGLQRDVTGTKSEEMARERLASIVESTEDAVIGLDLDGVVTSWNKAAERIYGYSAAEIVGRPIRELIPEERTASEQDVFARVINGESVDHYETVRRSLSGALIDVSLTISPIRDASGKVVGASKIVRDISARKLSDRVLNENRLMLSMAMQSSLMGVWENDLITGTVAWSEELEAIFGLPKRGFRGTEEHFFELVHEDDREATWHEIQQAVQEKRPYAIEFRFYHTDGSTRWMEGRGEAVYSSTGEPVRLYGIGLDVTSRKLAEIELQRQALMLDAALEPVIVWELGGNIIDWNRGAEGLYGYTSDDAIGRTTHDLLKTKFPRSDIDIEGELIQNGSWLGELRHTTKAGEEIIVESRHQLVALNGRQLVLEANRDITSAKSALTALQESEQRFSRFMQQLPGLAWIKDIEGNYVYANEAAERSFGMTTAELFGKTDDEVFNPEAARLFKEHDRLAIESGMGRQFLETLLEPDGILHYSIVSKFPISGSDGKPALIGGMAIDITDQKLAEAELRQRVAFDEAVVTGMGEGLCTTDANGLVTSINPAAERLFGWTFEELNGKSIHEVAHYKHRDGSPFPVDDCKLLRVLDSGNALINEEDVFIRRDGSFFDVLFSSSPLKTGSKTTGLVVVFQDITERKHQERDHEFLFRLADVIRTETDPASLLQTSTEMLGEHLDLGRCFFSSIDLDAKTSTVVGEWIGSDAEPLVKTVTFDSYSDENLRAAFEGRAIVVADTATDPRTSDKFDISYGPEKMRSYVAVPQAREGWWSGILFASRPKPHVWSDLEVALIHTVSERVWLAAEKLRGEEALRRSERRAIEEYQRLLERIVPLAETLGGARNLTTIYRSLQEFICASMDCSGFFVSFYDTERQVRTAAFVWGEGTEIDIAQLPPMPVNVSGGPNSQAILGKQTIITSNYWDQQKSRPHVVLQKNGIDPMSSLVVPMIVQDRVIGTLEVQAHQNRAFEREHAIALEMAGNLAAVAIENVRLIDIEAKARSDAETANRMKDEFLSVLSHELRTPLNAMLGWVRILRGGTLDAERSAKALEIIERNTRQQSSLIEDLLDVSRIISGKMRIERELVDLIPSLEQAAESVRPMAVSKAVEFVVNIEREPLYLVGDAVRLQQVMINLLQNAVKFTSAEGRVELNWKRRGFEVVVSVTDTGVGIDQYFLPLIFDRFSQEDASTRRNNTGLGLGLTIVKNIVELHGGTVNAASDGPGHGATFTVSLPLSAEFYREAPVELPAAPVNGTSSSLEGVAILLVDDDEDGLMPLRLLLEKEKASVTCSSSAASALEELRSKDFNVLISDIGMPKMDGFELISELRKNPGERNSSIKAIAYTAYASEEDRNRVLSSGYQIHLAKPLDFDELLAAVKALGPESGVHSNGR